SNLGIDWWLIGIVDTGEVSNLTCTRTLIHAFGVTGFADLNWRIHEDFKEMTSTYHQATLIARCPVRTHCSTDHRTTMTHNFRGNISDASDVSIAVLFAEAQSV